MRTFAVISILKIATPDATAQVRPYNTNIFCHLHFLNINMTNSYARCQYDAPPSRLPADLRGHDNHPREKTLWIGVNLLIIDSYCNCRSNGLLKYSNIRVTEPLKKLYMSVQKKQHPEDAWKICAVAVRTSPGSRCSFLEKVDTKEFNLYRRMV